LLQLTAKQGANDSYKDRERGGEGEEGRRREGETEGGRESERKREEDGRREIMACLHTLSELLNFASLRKSSASRVFRVKDSQPLTRLSRLTAKTSSG